MFPIHDATNCARNCNHTNFNISLDGHNRSFARDVTVDAPNKEIVIIWFLKQILRGFFAFSFFKESPYGFGSRH